MSAAAKFCSNCGAPASMGTVCPNCGQPLVATHAAPSAPVASPPTPAHSGTFVPITSPPPERGWINHPLAITAITLGGLLGLFLKIDKGMHGDLSKSLSSVLHPLNGTYVNGQAGFPLTIRIEGDMAWSDMQVLRGERMHIEQHGNTVSMSGGTIIDASTGQPLEGAARTALTGGNEVDLLTLSDDGQSLTMNSEDGSKFVFTKQR